MNTIEETNINRSKQDSEARKQKRLERLGSNHRVCIICGEDDDTCLELHHIAGKDYGDDLCTVCRNCHRKLSDSQRDHPAMIGKTPVTLEMIGHLLLNLADFFSMLLDRLREYGYYLIDTARQGGQSS